MDCGKLTVAAVPVAQEETMGVTGCIDFQLAVKQCAT